MYVLLKLKPINLKCFLVFFFRVSVRVQVCVSVCL